MRALYWDGRKLQFLPSFSAPDADLTALIKVILPASAPPICKYLGATWASRAYRATSLSARWKRGRRKSLAEEWLARSTSGAENVLHAGTISRVTAQAEE